MKLFDNFQEVYGRADREEQHSLDERAAIYEFEAGFTRAEAEERSARDFLANQQQQHGHLKSRKVEQT